MPIYIHNSLTGKKEEFRPLKDKKVNMYTCGVTVYDECHIGHARSLYIFDVIRRHLKSQGYKVKFVRNITDIDDKIINKAKELNKSTKEISQEYIRTYKRDIKALGINEADREPLATGHIKDMIKHISGLIKKDYAYVVKGDVYFSVKKFHGYGKLSGQNIEQMISGARVEKDERKKDPLDFALWKKSKEDEPKWKSPWGQGRPGWHIECSVMSQKYLGRTLDIHAGGRDLIFPHHENEIAQSESLTAKPFANYWIHHGLLTINNQKMSKSLGNFVTIEDFIKEYKDSDLLKLFFLSTHYSHPIDYNRDKIEECRKQKKNFDNCFDSVNNWQSNKTKVVFSQKDIDKVNSVCLKFKQAMDDDFNFPVALASLFELMDLTSGFVSCDKKRVFNYAKSKLEVFLKLFGLSAKPKKKLPSKLLKMSSERLQAKKDKDYKRADAVREKIRKELKYAVADTGGSITFTEVDDEG